MNGNGNSSWVGRRGAMVVAALALVASGACGGDEGGADVGDAAGETVDDRIDAACPAGGALPPPTSCGTPAVTELPQRGRKHVPDGEKITYSDVPPSSGDHRPAWAAWGEYDYLPPQRWLHNLEHGGVAFLFDPCVDPSVVDGLRSFARAQPEDDSGPFRWVLTPFPGLPSGVAVVAWQWTWQAGCLDDTGNASLQTFLSEHYRNGPEDVAVDGSYTTGWLGR